MAKTKYFFNPKTLSYEKYKLSRWVLLLRGIGVFSFSIILGFVFFLLFSRFVDSPGEKKLKSANYDLVAELESINLQLNMLNNELSKLKEKDAESVYISVLEVRDYGRGYLSGVFYLRSKDETVNLLLNELKSKQETIKYIASVRDEYKAKLDKKWKLF